MKTPHYLYAFAAMLMIAAISCKEKEHAENQVENNGNDGIKPQALPTNLGVTGFKFPESESTIYGWLENKDTVSIADHAWGIWAGLTAQSGEKYRGESLCVFETWLGVKELAELSALGDREGGCTPVKKERTPLNIPRQFVHAQIFADVKASNIDTTFQVFETVSYNPSSACFATKNLIFNQSELDKYKVKNGIGKIPAFPNDAITTKPTYYAGKPDGDGLIRVPVWNGMPKPARVYGYDTWTSFVYADINNSQPANKKLTPVTSKNPTPEQKANATCNVSDFINYKLDAAGAIYINQHQDTGNSQFKAGDIILLVGMHVGTKEISNWTWQTYFWSYNPDAPLTPSSAFYASRRPAQVKGAAAHYAATTAYAMVWPNQPVNDGKNTNVEPIIAFNPYLEGGLPTAAFGYPNTLKPEYKYGVQTNCMTCHALAIAAPSGTYSTAQYISMNDTVFKNQVQLDFAWSIQGNINTKK